MDDSSSSRRQMQIHTQKTAEPPVQTSFKTSGAAESDAKRKKDSANQQQTAGIQLTGELSPSSPTAPTTYAIDVHAGSGLKQAQMKQKRLETKVTIQSARNLTYPQQPPSNDQEEPVDDKVLVELRNIHKTYLLGIEGVPALRGVSVKVNRGEFVIIYGTSGGGKTSLLNIVGTIDKPTKGELLIGGTVINPRTKDKVLANIRLSTLGFVFQSFNLLASMTAMENVQLPMTLKGLLTAEMQRSVAKASLEKVGLGHRLDHFPTQLSGGEQQRVTIARAIANNPQLLLLDEPTGDLDSKNTHKILDLLIDLNRNKDMTMLMVTHDMYLKNFAHRVIWMRDGKISKMEVIDEERRNRAFQDLQQRIAQDLQQQNQKLGYQGNYGPESKLQQVPQGDAQTWANTKIRQPQDYRQLQSYANELNLSTASSVAAPNRASTVGGTSLTWTESLPRTTASVHSASIVPNQAEPTAQTQVAAGTARVAMEPLPPCPKTFIIPPPTGKRSHRRSNSFTVPGYRPANPYHLVRQDVSPNHFL